MIKFKRTILLTLLSMGLIVANAAIADDSTEKTKDKAAGTNIPNGRQVGDTLEWNGRAWTPVTKPSTGFVLLDANGEVIGIYNPIRETVTLDINNTYWEVSVTSKGFTAAVQPGFNTYLYYTGLNCTGTSYFQATINPAPDLPFISIRFSYVMDNKLLELDKSTKTILVNTYYDGESCQDFNPSQPDTPFEVFTNSNTPWITIEDLSKYPTPFSIKAN